MRRKKHTNWKILLIIFCIFLLWFLFISEYSGINILKNGLRIVKKRNKIEASSQEGEKLMVEKDKIEKKDAMTIEKKARELGMAKPGEIIIRIREVEAKKPKGE